MQTETLTNLTSASSCTTSIEGSFEVTDRLAMNESLLGIRIIGREFEYLKGKIIDITEDGVMFDESRRSPTSDPKPTFYENRRIYTLTDSLGYLIKGKFPDNSYITDNLTLYFRKADDIDGKSYRLKMNTNEDFGYCIDPGEYLIEYFLWTRKNKDSDRTKNLFLKRFYIEENKSNYLGTIHLNNNKITSENELQLPITVHFRSEQQTMAGNFGLIGFLLSEASIDRKSVRTIKLDFEYEEDFKSKFDVEVHNLKIIFSDIDSTNIE